MAKEAVLFAEIHNKEPTYVGKKEGIWIWNREKM